MNIERANAAKQELLQKFGPVLEDCTIILGDRGFRIEAVGKFMARFKDKPLEVQGVPVLWSSAAK